jgi:pyridinium-3,5-bisthiocarboxylic acid mononucleotide nickel chelatase
MKLAYCDCFSGISGDMFLGALLDAGLPIEHLREQIGRLHLDEDIHLTLEETHKGALRAALFDVHVHEHEDGHAPVHEHGHAHEKHAHSHNRHWSDIRELIERSDLTERVKATTSAIFQRLAEAEARVHGTSVDEVHFHEVGAVDSIVDIAGAAVGLEYLGIERLYASALPLGSGKVNTQHGLLPVPAPATLELLRAANAPVVPSPAQVELVTPTGAAILATLATFEQPAMRISGTGIGAGRRDMAWPNVLRLIVGTAETGVSQPIVMLETNIDDMSGQVFGHVMGRLFAAGALDVFFTPIQMKKNRPATMLSVIARKSDEPALARLLLEETSTLGLRVIPVQRYEAQREMRIVLTEFGEVPVKLKLLDGRAIQAGPEYDVCARLATEHSVPLMRVVQAAILAAQQLQQESPRPGNPL